jgi:hypothetical protein
MCEDEDGKTPKTGKQWKFDPLGDIKDMIINLDGIVDDVRVCERERERGEGGRGGGRGREREGERESSHGAFACANSWTYLAQFVNKRMGNGEVFASSCARERAFCHSRFSRRPLSSLLLSSAE